MAKQKTILVTGASGALGGSVARALLKQQTFAVRIFTSHPTSENALSLQAMGAHLFVGDMDSSESLENAMDNCYGVFGVTSYRERSSLEYTPGTNLVEAAAITGISHFVLHTLPDYNMLSGGEFELPHYQSKASLKAYSQDLRLPATYIQAGFYYENFLRFFRPLPDRSGNFSFGFPQGNTRLAMVSVEDVGAVVARVFALPEEYKGRTLTVVGADENCNSYAAEMTRILGVPVQYQHIPRAVYARQNFPGAEELANMFEVQRLYIANRQQEMDESYRLYPDMQPFATWLRRNKERLLKAWHKQPESALAFV